jgi:hypothetical protein
MARTWRVDLSWPRRAAAFEVSGEPWVRLLDAPRRSPSHLAERRAVALLRRTGPLPLRILLDRVAHDLYCDELGRGGWAADIGCIGTSVFRVDAARVVEAAAELLWTIDTRPRTRSR